MTTTKGFRASALPPSRFRTPLLERHSRQITTQKSVFSESGNRSRCRWRVSDVAEQVYQLDSVRTKSAKGTPSEEG